MAGKLYIKTMGCQMNEYDSARMADLLADTHGLSVTDNPDEADENLEITTEDAQAMTIQLGRVEGLFVSPSAGAAAVGALRIAKRLTSGVVVTTFADAGFKSLSETFW